MGYLVLTREDQGEIYIGDDIVVKVMAIKRGQVRIGIKAPKGVLIARDDMIQGPKPAEAACEVPEPPSPKPKVGMAAVDYEGELVNKKLRELAQKRRAD